MSDEKGNYSLPLSAAQPADVGRLLRELNLVDEHLKQAKIRSPNRQVVVKTSAILSELLKVNSATIDNDAERDRLIKWLDNLRTKGVVINISFSSEASEAFTKKITEWFRQEIDPNCLIVIGLQPTIGIGSVVRTNNKSFDFSLRNRLKSTRQLLIDDLKVAKEPKGAE